MQRRKYVLEFPRHNGTKCPSLTDTEYCINEDCTEGERYNLDYKSVTSSFQKVPSSQKCCGDQERRIKTGDQERRNMRQVTF